jgi:hypothetical protein
MYKIKSEFTEYDFWKIPKNCVNAEWGNFEEYLKLDFYRKVRSAIVNWFNDTECKGITSFSINFNGYDAICLQSDKEMKEFYFTNYCVIDNYLFHHTNEKEYNYITKKYYDNKIVLSRIDKIKKIKNKIDKK